jgi:hypothetical protein
LHGNRAAALTFLASSQQLNCSTEKPLEINAGMFKKPVVLGSQKRLHHSVRNLTYFDWVAAFLSELCKQPSVAGVYTQRLLQLHIPEDIYRRQLRFNFCV